jgi:hypothetical protein
MLRVEEVELNLAQMSPSYANMRSRQTTVSRSTGIRSTSRDLLSPDGATSRLPGIFFLSPVIVAGYPALWRGQPYLSGGKTSSAMRTRFFDVATRQRQELFEPPGHPTESISAIAVPGAGRGFSTVCPVSTSGANSLHGRSWSGY